MQLSASQVGEILVIVVEDRRIDAAAALRFKERMVELTQGWKGRIILDLHKVDFLDSSGLGAVVGSMKQLGRDRQLDLAGLSATVDKVFRITRMDRVFRIYDSQEVAIQEISHVS